jgi:hypothetical protein
MQDVNPAIREAVTQGLRVLNLEMMHKSSEPTQPVPRPLLSESTARFVPPALHEHDRGPAPPAMRTLEYPPKKEAAAAASHHELAPVTDGQNVPDLGPAAALRSMRYFAYGIGMIVIAILIMLFLLHC